MSGMTDDAGSAGPLSPHGDADTRLERPWHLGVVTRIGPDGGSGVVRSETTGREYDFEIPFVEIRGAEAGALFEGLRVGFDLSWTARGLRASVIRVFD